VQILKPGTSLPHLLAAANALVTVNSTVAVDALTLGIPALVIGLPNNLTPFVDAGVMLGANTAPEIELALRRVLYDQEFRRQWACATKQFISDFHLQHDARAAARTAAAIVAVAERTSI
jgi:predicted glycosyltransferase